MNRDDKPDKPAHRELWLKFLEYDRDLNMHTICSDVKEDGWFHVIEIAALREVEKERDELRAAFEAQSASANLKLILKERDAANKRIEELEKQVLEWRDGHEHVVHKMHNELTAAISLLRELVSCSQHDFTRVPAEFIERVRALLKKTI